MERLPFAKPERPPRKTQAEKARRWRKRQQQSMRRSQTDPKSRETVNERSGGRCELRGPHCTGEATALHHRIHKGVGGVRGKAKEIADSPDNLVAACANCHAELGHGISVK